MTDRTDRTPIESSRRRLPPKITEIPAGTRESRCRGSQCGATFYFVEGRPIDPDVDGGMSPTETQPGRGILHHIVCPSRDEFPKKNRPPRE